MTDSTKKKLTVLAFTAGMLLGLLFTSASFIFRRRTDAKESIVYFTAAQAKLISSNVKCSLSFDDNKDANSILDSLKTQNYIAFAGIYDSDGRLFAYYYRDDIKKQGFKPPPPSKVKFRTRDGFIVITEPVIVEKKRIGTVCLWAQP